MKYKNLAILLTCHSLEDFPVHHEGEEAESLLANWTALWHPKLIADAEKLPEWLRTFEVPEDCSGYLLLCPITSDTELQTGFAQRAKEEGGKLIRRKTDRTEILDLIFEDSDQINISDELVADFLALGYCFLQIQLLTRQLRYSSNLDEVYFSSLVVAGAKAAVANEDQLATEKLQAAFDLLMEERDNYYPVNALLIDLTLVAETTLGKRFQSQLENQSHPTNLLVTGEVADRIAADPALREKVSDLIQSEKLSIVGGTQTESRLPLLSTECLIDEFARGQATYQNALNAKVDFFGRRRFGLATSLPQLLEHFGFKGAFHFTLDDGRFPEGMQIKSFWEGDGEARVEIFGKIPFDANQPGHFLNLGVKIGESFDMDHSAAICFVHWPGQNCVWFDDLKRISKFGSVLGKFVSPAEFLSEMDEPYQHDRFTTDQYQSPYFKQAIIRNQSNPISRSIEYWRRIQKLDGIRTLAFLTSIFSNDESAAKFDAVHRHQIISDFESLDNERNESLDNTLDEKQSEFAARFVEAISHDAPGVNPSAAKWVALNPTSSVDRKSLLVEHETGIPNVEKPIYATSFVDENKSQAHVICDVPSMGYVSFSTTKTNASSTKNSLIVEEQALRNEFIEVIIDRSTGGIRAVHDYKTRGNRISQVLAYRAKSKHDDSRFVYSKMEIDSCETTKNSTTLGEITTSGRLMFGSEKVATVKQKFQLFRGSRVIQFECELSEIDVPKSDPWNWYFASRFAYNDESSLISSTVNQTRQSIETNRFEAPHYIDLETLKSRTTILTGGAPYHVRRGDRYIDSILIVKGEQKRKFKFGIGVDLPNPLSYANSLLSEPLLVATHQSLTPEYCWLFHLDSKNVLVTNWSPLFEDGKAIGFRARMIETMGRESKFKLSAFKEIKYANRVNFAGEVASELKAKDGKIAIHLAPNQLMEVEVKW